MKDHARKLFEWFLKNRESLLAERKDRAVVICDFEVVADFGNEFEAADYARSNLKPDEFIIQTVSDDPSSFSVTISSIELVN